MKKSIYFDKDKAGFCCADPLLYSKLKEYSKRMRRFPTEAEELVWRYLTNNQLGKPFRRQFIIHDFIADFVCLPAKLVIEIDGGYHDELRQQFHDEMRTLEIEEYGFKVIRFTNEDVFSNIETVLKTIKTYI